METNGLGSIFDCIKDLSAHAPATNLTITLRLKYFAVILGLAGTILACTVLVELRVRYPQMIESASARQSSEAKRIASRIDERMSLITRVLQESVDIRWGDSVDSSPDEVLAELARVQKLLPEIISTEFTNWRSGRLVRVSRLLPDLVERISADSTQSSPNLSRERCVILPEFSATERLTGRVSCTSAESRQQIAGTIHLGFVGDLADVRVASDSMESYVLAPDRRLVAHSDPSLAVAHFGAVPSTGMPSPSASMMAGKGIRGEDAYWSAAPLVKWGWTVVVEQPKKSIDKAVADLIRPVLVILALASLAMLLASYALARSISRPILDAQLMARRFGDGDFSGRLRLTSKDEMGSLQAELNRMADQLSSYTRDLQALVDVKTEALTDANRQLAIASKHKSDFLAHMSHELRTPLNAVIGFSEMLRAQYFGPLNGKQEEYVRDIHASGQHLLALINDILDLAKVESGRMEFAPESVNVAAVVGACRDLLSQRFAHKKQTLTIHIESIVEHWQLDQRKFKQCLLNLLVNANKFTSESGQIELHAQVIGDQLNVSVSDTGVGIDATGLEQLFSEFYQAGRERHDASSEGTGLGLALTKRFVELHGGTISVASTLGHGTRFTMTFPRNVEES